MPQAISLTLFNKCLSQLFGSVIGHRHDDQQRIPESAPGINCTENDALIIDSCVSRLKQKRPDEYALLVEHYIKDISKRALATKLKLSEGMIRIKFQMAEGFIEGCLAMLDVRLEMD